MAKKRYCRQRMGSRGHVARFGTLKRFVYAKIFENEINDLGSWVSEIHSGMYGHVPTSSA